MLKGLSEMSGIEQRENEASNTKDLENEGLTDQQKKEKERRTLFDAILGKLREVKGEVSFELSFTDIKVKAELCIFRVPEKLKKVKEDAYSPRVVAIGPLHRDKVNLALRLQHKMCYMSSFLRQDTGVHDSSENTRRLKECSDTIHKMVEAIRHCYTEEINCTSNELAEMMLVDGCFILELFLRYESCHKSDMRQNDDESDPVLKSAWTLTALKHDLALLENQIPFFVLETLYGIVSPSFKERCKSCNPPKSVSNLALTFFKRMSKKEITEKVSDIECKHLLDLLHIFYFPPAPAAPAARVFSKSGDDLESNIPATNNKWGFNKCASELLESGIEFRKGPSTEESLLNITFNKPRVDGVINIPELHIHDTTSISLFRNLIAFEQCSLSSTQSVTSYAFLMRSLISSSRDSEQLKKRSIIWHRSNGDEKYLATKFASMLEGVDLVGNFCFRDVCDRVNKYHKCWCSLRRLKVFVRKQIRCLWDDYLSSAWKVMSIVAAIIILVLTSLQTYYTIQG